MDEDKLITVCESCFMVSCWKGIFLCDDGLMNKCGTTEKSIKELRELHLEHSSYWEIITADNGKQ